MGFGRAARLRSRLDGAFDGRGEAPIMRLSGRAVNKLPGLSPSATSSMMRRRAAQLWR